jgi:hypothetical protein
MRYTPVAGDVSSGARLHLEYQRKQAARVWLESAQNDLGAGGAPGTYRNFDLANRRMAASLQMRGYHYVYDHALNAGHEDPKVISQTLPSAMLWLWRGYPID